MLVARIGGQWPTRSIELTSRRRSVIASLLHSSRPSAATCTSFMLLYMFVEAADQGILAVLARIVSRNAWLASFSSIM